MNIRASSKSELGIPTNLDIETSRADYSSERHDHKYKSFFRRGAQYGERAG